MMNSSVVLDIFKEITRIPRESGHEAPMTAWLQAWAEAHGLEHRTDAIGNVLIIRNAAPGKENVPALVLQGHQDMVCEKVAGCSHDFTRDPIRYEIEDGWMIARDTTLGADDGIGCAAALALLQSDLPTGRLECLFTISEETGMDGAFALEEGFFEGRTLINLDNEDEGQMCIGCAGGQNTDVTFRYTPGLRNEAWTGVSLRIGGATGGHSGEDINKGRINTVREMALFLREELEYGFQLLLLSGGGKSNAIARECEAAIVVPDPAATIARFNGFGAGSCRKYAETDPELIFTSGKCHYNEKVVDDSTCKALIEALCECPHGVEAMCADIPGLVQTSNNLASVHMRERGSIEIQNMSRSSVTAELDALSRRIADIFRRRGAEVTIHGKYPGWAPNVHSSILSQVVASYNRLFGKDPEVLAIHAGLECGLFLEKFPYLDMISFGPTLRGVHAPGEKMDLASLDKFMAHLTDVVCNFK